MATAGDARRDAALAACDAVGVPRRASRPPLYRLFWRTGVPLPPPSHAPFLVNVAIAGPMYALVFAAIMATFFSGGWGPADLLGAALYGVIMGVFQAMWYRRLQRESGFAAT